MDRRTFLTTSAAALTSPLVAGCGGGGGNGGGASTPTQTPTPTPSPTPTETISPWETPDGVDAAIAVAELWFRPHRMSVEPGTTVGWKNLDDLVHAIQATRFTENSEDWDFTAPLSSGATATYTFEEPGIYQYKCAVHRTRAECGAVLVGDVTLEENMPCEGTPPDLGGSGTPTPTSTG